MPYSPPVTYRGDMHLARGLGDLGQGLAAGLEQFRRNRDESRYLDTQLEGMAAMAAPMVQAGRLDPALVEEWVKTSEMPLPKKRAAAAGFAFAIHQAQQQEQEQARRGEAMGRMELDRGRLMLDAQRMAGLEAERTAESGRRARLTEEVAGYAQAPEGLRMPMDEFMLGALARSGSLTPEAAAEFAAMPLRQREAGVRERTVEVQERQQDNTEKRAAAADAGRGTDDRRLLISQRTQVLARLADPTISANPEAGPLLKQQLALIDEQLAELGVKPAKAAGVADPAGGKGLDRATAAEFMRQAGGDKNKARELARKAGYTP